MANFFSNIDGIINRLEAKYKTSIGYNDEAKLREMMDINTKISAYKEVLLAVHYDYKTRNKVIPYFERFDDIRVRAHHQIDVIFKKSGV